MYSRQQRLNEGSSIKMQETESKFSFQVSHHMDVKVYATYFLKLFMQHTYIKTNQVNRILLPWCVSSATGLRWIQLQTQSLKRGRKASEQLAVQHRVLLSWMYDVSTEPDWAKPEQNLLVEIRATNMCFQSGASQHSTGFLSAPLSLCHGAELQPGRARVFPWDRSRSPGACGHCSGLSCFVLWVYVLITGDNGINLQLMLQ